MNFTTAIGTCFRKYVDFQGRARRSEYWYWWLFYVGTLAVLVGFAAFFAAFTMFDLRAQESRPLLFLAPLGLFYLVTFLPALAVEVRRFHDLGVSGLLVVVFGVAGLIPWVGFLATVGKMIWFAQRGTRGGNDYGPDPCEPDPSEVFA